MYTQMMEDVYNIPFSVVGQGAWNELANKLDPETSIIGNNWRILAEKLGFTTEHILNINARQSSHGRNTLKLLEDYIKLNGNSVGAVKRALVDMERPDAVEVLDNHMPDIRKNFLKSRHDIESRNMIAVQNSCYTPSNRFSSLGFHGHNLSTPPPAHCQPSQYTPNFHVKSSCPSSTHHSTVFNDLSRNGNSAISYSSNKTKDYNVMSSSFMNGRSTDHYSSMMTPENLSKIVHVDPRDVYTSDDMDISDSFEHREEGQPIPAAIQRDQHYRNIAKKPCLTKTGKFSQNDMDDVEEDCPSVRDKRRDLRLNIQARSPCLIRDQDVISPSPSPASGTGTPLPLAQLNQFAKSDSFMPSGVYAAMMQDKNQLEFEQGRRAQNKDPNFKVSVTSNHKCGRILDFHISSSFPQSAMRKVEDEMPRTFPLRNKEFIYPLMPSKERPSILKPSISVPNDMKPAEYRKAFKHIKVFVTYAGDSKKHIQRVLNLCRCLEKNGFTCCMDMFDKRMEISNRQDWCAQRFSEADFILMCLSPQYKMEVEAHECDGTIDDKELHIQYIYSLMLTEMKQNGHRNSRVIPLLFEGSDRDQIPVWLQNSYIYKWPNQYRDLLWCLTKPHTRIKPRTQFNQTSPSSPTNGQSVSL